MFLSTMVKRTFLGMIFLIGRSLTETGLWISSRVCYSLVRPGDFELTNIDFYLKAMRRDFWPWRFMIAVLIFCVVTLVSSLLMIG